MQAGLIQFLLLAVAFSVVSAQNCFVPDEINSRVFVFEQYVALNPDLNLTSINEARQHWMTWGLEGGRQAAFEFDAQFYIESYPDVPTLYGRGAGRALSHYVLYGVNEKRIGSPFQFEWSYRLFLPYIFNSTYYLNKYDDLRNLKVVNEATARRHWIKFGIYQGRRASAEFDPAYYIANNADIKQIFGAQGYLGGLIHYVDHGRSEGRKGTN
eukprot:TRINITY_DN1272_c0_g1_i1.p1 TRINITY_DN1272_c0_g1~~TRINITY_DN1272_c0_g1_i1.p1  ORF type:complete len:230 (-),score=65.02 TRINITY_DN1272_c0_g1_i1:77-712(-)